MTSPTTPSPVTAPLEQVLPPPTLLQDDPIAASAARQRLTPTSRLPRIFSLSRLRFRSRTSPSKKGSQSDTVSETSSRSSETQGPLTAISPSVPSDAPIILNDNALQGAEGETKDKYEWAVVYENQRGMTAFSIPYYSALSLLPTDPSAFTLPNTSHKRSQQPPITLSTYPLPDGNWRWVSRTWMIDMRSDSGIVQHDGFEYNWVFRRHNWRAEVGFLSAGGWVRRRRWVRLMMRPGKNTTHSDSGISSPSSSTSSRSNLLRHSMASSNLSSASDLLHATVENVWRGIDPDDDWRRCRAIMLRYGRDGRKNDLWRIWLGYYHPAYEDQFRGLDNNLSKGKQKQWTEDEGPLPSQRLEPDAASHRSLAPPPREYITPVLQKHGHNLLQLFVYPDSRVEFLKLLGKAGLLPDLGISIGGDFNTSEVEFWSYTSGLMDEFKYLDVSKSCSIQDTTSCSPLLTPQRCSEQD